MMINSVYSFVAVLCFIITSVKSDSVRYYYDYECNEPLLENAKLTATSSLRERGPENAILYGSHMILQINQLKMAYNTRWAFDANSWEPTKDQVLAISSFIQPEEKQRISKFVFLKDAKSSLIGRLMIRKYLSTATAIPYQNISVGRDELGKPYLLTAVDSSVNFNVSHQGDFVVLAGNTKQKIGIDVMKTEPPINKDVSEFFRLMKRQFSEVEWKKIQSYKTDPEKLACFYRIWCLKESYLKNIGIGVASVPLDSLSFSIQEQLKVGNITTSTKLYENNLVKDFIFEETLLNESYIVAVALKIGDSYERQAVPFTLLRIEDLLKEAQPLNEPDPDFACNFLGKKEKPY